MDDVEKWVKKSNKKEARLMSSVGGVYEIVYFDKGKVRVGVVRDGMYCRYGIDCFGAMESTDPMSLWQSRAGNCTPLHVKHMQDYLSDCSALPDFDFSTLRDLKH